MACRIALCLLVLGALARPAAAQEHAETLIDAKVEIVGNAAGRLEAVRNVWRMDGAFSHDALDAFDADGDGALGGDEVAEAGQTIKDSIARWDFYTVVEAGGAKVPMRPPDAIRALWRDGRLLLFFEVRPVADVDLAAAELSVTNFDPMFYASFVFARDGGFTLVDMPEECALSVRVPDQDAAAKQWVEHLDELGTGEAPENDPAAARILATRAEVACSGT